MKLDEQGKADPYMLCLLGEHYREEKDSEKGIEYFTKSAEAGYAKAAVLLYDALRKDGKHYDALESVYNLYKNGLTDIRVLEKLTSLISVIFNNPHKEMYEEGRFKHQTDIAHHYVDLLVERKSPLGYHFKGRQHYAYYDVICQFGEENHVEALRVWEEVDELGYANFETYSEMINICRYVDAVSIVIIGIMEIILIADCVRSRDNVSIPFSDCLLLFKL